MSLNSIFLDSFYSLVRVMVASVLAFLISLVIGSALHRHRRYYILFLPFINFIRQISPFVWMPFAIIFVGLGELPIAVVLFTAMVFPGIIMIYEVIDSFPDDLYEEALIAGANEKEIFLSIKIPMLRNQFINVFRFQWSMGWTTVIAAEMLGVSSGLGFRLLDFQYLLQYENMLVYIVIIGGIGILSDQIIRRIAG